MKTSLVKGLDKDQSKQIEDAFMAASLLRDRLVKVLNEKYESCEAINVSKESYNNPNWALLKADETGYKRALKEISSLLK